MVEEFYDQKFDSYNISAFCKKYNLTEADIFKINLTKLWRLMGGRVNIVGYSKKGFTKTNKFGNSMFLLALYYKYCLKYETPLKDLFDYFNIMKK